MEMKARTLCTWLVAVACCIMLVTPAFGDIPCPFGPGMCGNAPIEDAITMPATGEYYPSLDPPCVMKGDHTAIFFNTTEETIKSLLPPNVMYVPVEVNLRNIWGIPEGEFPGFCETVLGGTYVEYGESCGECNIKPFGDDYVMILSLIDYVETSCYGPYREVLLLIPSVALDPDPEALPCSEDPAYWQYHYDLGPMHVGLYNPYLWLSSDSPIAAGREVWGFPKKMAEIKFKDKHGRRIWKVERSLSEDGTVGGDHLPILHKETRTAPIIEAWLEPDTSAPRHPDEVRFPPLFQAKIIPSVDGVTADIKQLNLVPLDPQTSGEPNNPYVFFGEAGVELIGGPDDPLNEIDVNFVYGGYQFRYNFELSSGRTLTDYLAE